MRDLSGLFPGGRATDAKAINDNDVIVEDATGLLVPTTFIYQNGVMTALNSLLPVGTNLTDVYGIDDSGDMIRLNASGQAEYLSPSSVPEPTSLCIVATAAGGLILRRREKRPHR